MPRQSVTGFIREDKILIETLHKPADSVLEDRQTQPVRLRADGFVDKRRFLVAKQRLFTVIDVDCQITDV
jgi:hypothetical protein